MLHSKPHSKSFFTTKVRGELCIIGSGILGGIMPVLVDKNLQTLPILWFAGFSTLVAMIPAFLFSKIRKHKLPSIETLKDSFRPLLYSSLILGVFYWSILYWAMTKTSPQNAAILFLFEILTSMLLLRKKNGESLSSEQVLGSLIIIISSIIVIWPKDFKFNSGDIAIILACFIPPNANLMAKQARQNLSSEFILFFRSLISGFILCLMALFISGPLDINQLRFSLPIILINGILTAGLAKLLWNEGIARIQIAKSTALAAIAPFITFLSAWLILGKAANLSQLVALPLVVVGLGLLTVRRRRFRD